MKRPALPPFALTIPALFTLLATLTVGWAQPSATPLAALAPADTVLSLGMQARPGTFGTLGDDLAALGWERAGETLDRLAVSLDDAAEDDAGFFNAFLEGFLEGLVEGTGQDAEDAFSRCVAGEYEDDAATADVLAVSTDALLTVSVSAFNPVPAATALLRADPELAATYEEVRGALLDCAERTGVVVQTLEQGGVTLYVVNDGGDFPFVVGNVDALFFASTDPDTARAVVRRASGSAEPSLADGALYQKAAALEAGESNLSLTLDFAALAEVLEGFGGMVASSPEDDYLVERGVALLRTLGGYAGVLSATPEGLLFESVTAVDPEGGDAALARLLLGENVAVGSPFLAPAGSLSAAAFRLPTEELFDYVQDLLDAAPPSLEVSVNLREVLREALGFDIDRGLFDWLGPEAYGALLEPVGPDLGALLYGQEQVLVIPVAGRETAEAGFEELVGALTPFFDEAVASDPDTSLFLTQIASEEVSYKGETYTRYRFSVNGDVGVGFIEDYLVVGTPSRALETLIDTFVGDEESLLGTERYRAATQNTPGRVLGSGYVETGRLLSGYAELLDVFTQPLAFVLSVGLSENLAETGSSGTVELDYDADLTGVEATPFDVGSSTVSDSFAGETYESRHYALSGLEAGGEVTVTLTGLSDAYLYLINETESVYISESETYGSSSAQFTFVPEAGVDYWLEILNYGFGTEDYTLSVTRSPAEDVAADAAEVEVEAAQPLSFGDLLHLAEIVPATLRVLGEHVGVSTSYTEVRDGAIYQHSLTRIDW